jgi:outer membrane protein OmpU
MKSILFASTALVAFAGAAAAQGVTLTGNAEMGIFGADGIDTQFFTDVDVTFTMAGETDGGLTFGATVDLDEGGSGAAAVADNTDDGGATIFLSGAFGTLTMGDTDGALDWALTEVAFNSGSLADDETEHGGYNGNSGHDGAGGGDGQILRYDYSFGDFGVALSAEQIPGNNSLEPLVGAADDTIIGVGLRYGLDLGGSNVDFGIGYQESDVAEVAGLSVSGSFAGFNAGLSYMMFDLDGTDVGDYDHVGIGVGYTTGAISVSANYGVYDNDGGLADVDGFGLSAGYDLGGGAIVQFGYGYTDVDGVGDSDTFSLGVRMNF